MNKETRLQWIKERHEKHLALTSFDDRVGELPLSKTDIKETIEEMESFKEFDKDKKSSKEALTSDEV